MKPFRMHSECINQKAKLDKREIKTSLKAKVER